MNNSFQDGCANCSKRLYDKISSQWGRSDSLKCGTEFLSINQVELWSSQDFILHDWRTGTGFSRICTCLVSPVRQCTTSDPPTQWAKLCAWFSPNNRGQRTAAPQSQRPRLKAKNKQTNKNKSKAHFEEQRPRSPSSSSYLHEEQRLRAFFRSDANIRSTTADTQRPFECLPAASSPLEWLRWWNSGARSGWTNSNIGDFWLTHIWLQDARPGERRDKLGHGHLKRLHFIKRDKSLVQMHRRLINRTVVPTFCFPLVITDHEWNERGGIDLTPVTGDERQQRGTGLVCATWFALLQVSLCPAHARQRCVYLQDFWGLLLLLLYFCCCRLMQVEFLMMVWDTFYLSLKTVCETKSAHFFIASFSTFFYFLVVAVFDFVRIY